MYPVLLTVHSILRWIVLMAAIVAVVRSWQGWLGNPKWTNFDDKTGLIFVISIDLQVLIGLLMYFFFSPLLRQAFGDIGAAMSSPVLRFWLVEHSVLMFAALALVHIGRARSRKWNEPVTKRRTAAKFYTTALILILIGIPWPFYTGGRPLW